MQLQTTLLVVQLQEKLGGLRVPQTSFVLNLVTSRGRMLVHACAVR